MSKPPIRQMDEVRLREFASALPGPASCDDLVGPLYGMIEKRAKELGITVHFKQVPSTPANYYGHGDDPSCIG